MQLQALRDETKGFREMAVRAVEAIDPPRVVTRLLAIALVGTIAWDGFEIHQSLLLGSRIPPSAAKPAQISTLRIDAIVNAHLFGAAPDESRARAAQEAIANSIVFALTGTIAMSDPAKGYALVGPTGAVASFHAVGTEIADGVLLRGVYADHVEIERAGRTETLMLPREALANARLVRVGHSSGDDPEPEAKPGPDDAVRKLAAESERLAALMKVEPLLSGGQLRGIVVEPGTDPTLLAQLGLRPGDAITHVDGVMIVQTDRLDFLRKALSSGQPVRVGVLRPDEGPQEITLNSARFAGLISN